MTITKLYFTITCGILENYPDEVQPTPVDNMTNVQLRNALGDNWMIVTEEDVEKVVPTMGNVVIRTITGYGDGNGGWTLIASPVLGSIAPDSVGNIFNTSQFDLYRFNQSSALQWENYKIHSDDFVLQNGLGYLYACKETVNLVFSGEFCSDTSKDVPLLYDEHAALKGFNLVGNPFTRDAYLAIGDPFLEMNGDGSGFVLAESPAIAPMKGIFIEAAPDQDVVTFLTERPENTGKSVTLRLGNGRSTNMDAVRIRLDGGRGMAKLVLNDNATSLYIPENGKDCSVVTAEAEGRMPVNFKAADNGTYSLCAEIDNAKLRYLHLVDNLTGNDVDLLANPCYTFEAATTDYAARFSLVFAENTSVGEYSEEPFAFIANGNIVVNGEGTLQVIDITGRIIVNREGVHTFSTTGMTPGVYVLRLICGENVKTQKMVIE